MRAVGIYAINLTISEQSTGTLNITTRLFPFYLGSLESKGGTLNLTSYMEGAIAKNIQINSTVTAWAPSTAPTSGSTAAPWRQ